MPPSNPGPIGSHNSTVAWGRSRADDRATSCGIPTSSRQCGCAVPRSLSRSEVIMPPRTRGGPDVVPPSSTNCAPFRVWQPRRRPAPKRNAPGTWNSRLHTSEPSAASVLRSVFGWEADELDCGAARRRRLARPPRTRTWLRPSTGHSPSPGPIRTEGSPMRSRGSPPLRVQRFQWQSPSPLPTAPIRRQRHLLSDDLAGRWTPGTKE